MKKIPEEGGGGEGGGGAGGGWGRERVGNEERNAQLIQQV